MLINVQDWTKDNFGFCLTDLFSKITPS